VRVVYRSDIFQSDVRHWQRIHQDLQATPSAKQTYVIELERHSASSIFYSCNPPATAAQNTTHFYLYSFIIRVRKLTFIKIFILPRHVRPAHAVTHANGCEFSGQPILVQQRSRPSSCRSTLVVIMRISMPFTLVLYLTIQNAAKNRKPFLFFSAEKKEKISNYHVSPHHSEMARATGITCTTRIQGDRYMKTIFGITSRIRNLGFLKLYSAVGASAFHHISTVGRRCCHTRYIFDGPAGL
jgi:hypothetical protein